MFLGCLRLCSEFLSLNIFHFISLFIVSENIYLPVLGLSCGAPVTCAIFSCDMQDLF